MAMPGITERVFIRACKKNGLQGQAKILSLSDDQWDALEKDCASIIGLPPDWKDIRYDETIKSLRAKDRAMGNSEFKLYKKKDLLKDREESKGKQQVLEENNNLLLF